MVYDPSSTKLLTFYDKLPAFLEGHDTPRAYLERCLKTIEAREPAVKAFVTKTFERARRAADEATKRYKEGKPLSPLDGMPIAIKGQYFSTSTNFKNVCTSRC